MRVNSCAFFQDVRAGRGQSFAGALKWLPLPRLLAQAVELSRGSGVRAGGQPDRAGRQRLKLGPTGELRRVDFRDRGLEPSRRVSSIEQISAEANYQHCEIVARVAAPSGLASAPAAIGVSSANFGIESKAAVALTVNER